VAYLPTQVGCKPHDGQGISTKLIHSFRSEARSSAAKCPADLSLLKLLSILLAVATAITLILTARLGFRLSEDVDHFNKDLQALHALAFVLLLLFVGAVVLELIRDNQDRP
jgi:hypothetical protein